MECLYNEVSNANLTLIHTSIVTASPRVWMKCLLASH